MRNTLTLFWLRILAFLLDYLFIAAYLGILFGVAYALTSSPIGERFLHLWENPNMGELMAFLLLVLPILLYFALCEASHWQASWGKRKMGLIVTDVHGKRLGLGRSLARSLLKLIPWELTHACLWRIPGWPLATKEIPPLIELGLSLSSG